MRSYYEVVVSFRTANYATCTFREFMYRGNLGGK